jgi:hypothetical protein
LVPSGVLRCLSPDEPTRDIPRRSSHATCRNWYKYNIVMASITSGAIFEFRDRLEFMLPAATRLPGVGVTRVGNPRVGGSSVFVRRGGRIKGGVTSKVAKLWQVIAFFRPFFVALFHFK